MKLLTEVELEFISGRDASDMTNAEKNAERDRLIADHRTLSERLKHAENLLTMARSYVEQRPRSAKALARIDEYFAPKEAR